MFNAQVHAKAVFGVVFKQAVCPARAVACRIFAVRHGRCACAPDGGAASCVGNHHAVANKLGNKFGIRGFAAACACTAELKQRLFKLHAFNGVFIHRVRFRRNLLHCVIPVFGFGKLGFQRFHYQGFFLSRANLSAVAAAGAVHRRYCHMEF